MAQAQWSDKPHLRWLTLFITSGTLICCALLILLVSPGFGAVVASLSLNISALVFIAEHNDSRRPPTTKTSAPIARRAIATD